MTKKSKIHYAWWILISCCAIQGATLGVIINSRGLYYSFVCQELGFSLGSFLSQQLFYGIFTIVAMPLVRKLLLKYNIRIVVSIALIVFDISSICMAFLNTLQGWYVLASLQGLSGAFLMFYMPSLLLNNWFYKKKGIAMGIYGASSGLLGMAVNIIGAMLITSIGWRTCYVISGVFSFVLAAPFSIFVICLKPSDKELVPYGSWESQPQSMANLGVDTSFKDAIPYKTKWAILCLILITMTIGICSCFVQHISNYAVSTGLPLVTGGLMASFAMGGSVIGKFLMGLLNDGMEIKKLSFIGYTVLLISFVILTLSGTILYRLLIGVSMNGFSMSIYTVLMPLIVSNLFSKYFSRIMVYMTISSSIAMSIGGTLIGYFYDTYGSYQPIIIVGGALTAFCMILLAIVFKLWNQGERS